MAHSFTGSANRIGVVGRHPPSLHAAKLYHTLGLARTPLWDLHRLIHHTTYMRYGPGRLARGIREGWLHIFPWPWYIMVDRHGELHSGYYIITLTTKQLLAGVRMCMMSWKMSSVVSYPCCQLLNVQVHTLEKLLPDADYRFRSYEIWCEMWGRTSKAYSQRWHRCRPILAAL